MFMWSAHVRPFNLCLTLLHQFCYMTFLKFCVIRMVQFVDTYDPPLKGLHDDLNFVSPRIGEVRLSINLDQSIANTRFCYDDVQSA